MPEALDWADLVVGSTVIAGTVLLLARRGWRSWLGLWLLVVLAGVPAYLLTRDEPRGWSWGFVGGLNMALTAGAVLVLVVPSWRRWLLSQNWGSALLGLTVWGMFVSAQVLRHNPLAAWSFTLSFILACTLVWLDLSSVRDRDEEHRSAHSPGGAIEWLVLPAIMGAIALPAIQIPDNPLDYSFLGMVAALLVWVVHRAVRRRLMSRRERQGEAR